MHYSTFPNNKKYQIIYADLPLHYNDKALAGNRGAECHYDVMSDEQIYNLPVDTIADDNCSLFLWGTWPKIHVVLNAIWFWKFKYKTCAFVWVKTNKNNALTKMNMGHYTRSNTEFVLYATKGNPVISSHDIKQVYASPQLPHSEKPDYFRRKIVELCGNHSRIELFSRISLPDWDTFGNDEKLLNKPIEDFNLYG